MSAESGATPSAQATRSTRPAMTTGGTARFRRADRASQRPRAFLTPTPSSPNQKLAYASFARKAARTAATRMYSSALCWSFPHEANPSRRPAITSAGVARRTTGCGRDHSDEPGFRATSGPLGRPLAEQSLRPEDEDHDQDAEDERLGPLRPRAVPAEALVEVLDQTDQERAEHRAGQVADTSEDRGGEREQTEREARAETDLSGVERKDDTARPRERAG